ncbi:MFS family permease [Microbacterium phyllosphaerae]|uniref:MFS family permease n=1 Tax=Microbacterium phyllosphaerae TaxID=124798 RepID=A0ABS4WPM0_9MICO|nr:MFS transporter [Microbacterium phyllosphaerae]MBP2377484.1 MFS family permease [Microbacterium phyllosphaerae]
MTAESVDEPAELSATAPGQRPRRIHPAWIVALVALIALIGAAGFRAAPGVLMLPLQDEFGWTTAELSLAVTVNLLLFGLTAPFAAALMQRFGIRSVTVTALFVIGAGAALSVFVATPAQLILTWGVLIGLGTGSMALVFAATITDTWFATRRGLVSGWLTDRVNPRILLAAYYALRGVSLLFLPSLLSAEVQPSIVVFIVIYGLDWVATVPPTIALCREVFGDRGPLVFGWVFASHQIGAGIASVLAGLVRDHTGQYTVAWFAAAGLCAVAALVSATIRRHPASVVPD